LVLLLLLLPAGIYSLSNLSSMTDWLKHTDKVRVSLARVLSTLVDAETGNRGYVLVGDPKFLEPYNKAASLWKTDIDEVRALTGDNVGQQQRLDHLRQLAGKRFELLNAIRTEYDAGRRGAELKPLMVEGKRTMDEIRALVATLDQEEARVYDLRQDQALSQWRWTMLFFVGGALAFLLIVGALWIQRRDADVQRQRAEDVARARELFSIVLQGVDMGITVQDAAGRLVYANEAAARIIGYGSPEELLTASVTEVMGRFDVLNFDGTPFPLEQMPNRAALEGKASSELPLRFRVRGTREERWSLVRAVPSHDVSGKKVLHVINFFREVTEEIRDNHQRSFLLRAVDELNSSLDYEKTLSAVARLAVPTLADWCAIDLAAGDRTKRVAIAHVDPEKLAFVEALERRYPPDPAGKTGVPQILRTGKHEFIAEIPRELLLAAAVDADHLRLIDELQLCSYIGVPLTVRSKTIGAITFAMAESARRYTEKDLEFAQALADRAALAIDNARLFREAEQARAVATAQRDQTEERFRLMIESVRDYAIFMLDPNGLVATWNIGAQLIKGYRPDEIIGQHFSRFYPDYAARSGDCQRKLEIAARVGRFEDEGWRVRKDGSRFWASVIITPITDAQGRLKGFAKITRDLSERKRNEEALAAEELRRKEAENESQFAQTFIGILGHDLRNPLNAIIMAATLMKKKANGNDTKTIDRVLSSSSRMTNMVAQLLDLTRSRLAGGISVEKKPGDLSALITGIVDELRLAFPGRDIRWENRGQEHGSWDQERLAQVCSNLVGNALQHGDATKAVTVRLLPAGRDSVALSVHSHGHPISSDLLPVIFEPYRRNTANAERSKGLGLGLFITHQIVEAHGGDIDVRSTAEEGTTFTATLPRSLRETVAEEPRLVS